MSNFLSRLYRSKKLTPNSRYELFLKAIQLHSSLTTSEVEEYLLSLRVSKTEAESIATSALERYEAQLSRETSLPESSHEHINYYFVLGINPKASTEEIQKAYRLKVKFIHPDQRIVEFDENSYSKAMKILGDAKKTLSDPVKRRAYDALWHHKSRQITKENSKPEERRGDWETRFRWNLAEIGQMEEVVLENLYVIERAYKNRALHEAQLKSFNELVEKYEGDILELRTQSYAFPETFVQVADQVLQEMHRKEKLIRQLNALIKETFDSTNYLSLLSNTVSIAKEIREKHHLFEIYPLIECVNEITPKIRTRVISTKQYL